MLDMPLCLGNVMVGSGHSDGWISKSKKNLPIYQGGENGTPCLGLCYCILAENDVLVQRYFSYDCLYEKIHRIEAL